MSLTHPVDPAGRPGAGPEDEETARLVLEEMGPLGDTWATFDGERINVFGGIPGEEVMARIVRYRRRKRPFVSALVTAVLIASPHRVATPCPYFGPCTGCQWQHIEYGHQLELKRKAVERELSRYPALGRLAVSDTLPSPQPFNYRNHARFTVRLGGALGFINRITRRFTRVDECMLMDPWINSTLASLQDRCAETTQLSVRYGVNTGDWLIQPPLQNVDIPVASGQTHYTEAVLGRRLRIASPSFAQVNTRQTERMAELVIERLKPSHGGLLVDAYAGVGTFAVLMAPHFKSVVAIEESVSAVKDAVANGVGIDNLDYLEGKTEDVLDSLDQTPDAVILDPPRAGCHPQALEALVRRPPGRIVYVSCDPESLARDLDLLEKGGFRVESIEPLDMFPQTHHVECIATLVKNER